MQEAKWLLFLYSLPAQPSAPRVHVWRQVNELGALRLPSGGYVLPENADNRAALLTLHSDISAQDGVAALFQATPLSAELSADLRERYNAARSAEYTEIERECAQLRGHIQREIEHFVFTYDEIEELEAELRKIQQRFDVVERRDVFEVSERAAATVELEACSELLASYTAQVFERESGDGTES